MGYLVEFDKIPWNNITKGLRAKSFVHGNQQMWLVEFSEGFIEPDWCKKGHAGYIVDGACSIDFSGRVESYKKGDALFIPGEERAKHKVIVGKCEKVTMLLFEII